MQNKEQKYFVCVMPDESIRIIHGVPKCNLEKQFGHLTDEQYTSYVLKGAPKDNHLITEIQINDIPIDRSNRSNWKWDDSLKRIIVE